MTFIKLTSFVNWNRDDARISAVFGTLFQGDIEHILNHSNVWNTHQPLDSLDLWLHERQVGQGPHMIGADALDSDNVFWAHALETLCSNLCVYTSSLFKGPTNTIIIRVRDSICNIHNRGHTLVDGGCAIAQCADDGLDRDAPKVLYL